jgi:1-deoxy-D-xylulose-5-phosphate reductoisomerase
MAPPDPARYPCLGLARAAATTGGTAPAVFNAANEVAVAAFVAGRLPFTGIAELVGRTLAAVSAREPGSLDEVLAADAETRVIASGLAPGLGL